MNSIELLSVYENRNGKSMRCLSVKYELSDIIKRKKSEEDDERHSRGDNLVFNEQ